MSPVLVYLLAAVAGALHLRAEHLSEPNRIRILRPLTTALWLLGALLTPDPQSGIYQGSVVAGLLLAIIGDAASMLPDEQPAPRLIAYALSHTAFILAFTGDARGVMHAWLGVPFGAYALALYLYLVPQLGRRRFGLLIAIVLAAVVGWAGWGRWRLLNGSETLVGASGATLLMLASGLTMIDRHRRPLGAVRLAVLAGYHLAHFLLAWSV